MVAAQIMTRPVVAISTSSRARTAMQVMRERGVRHVPVVDSRAKVVGMLSDRDFSGLASMVDYFGLGEEAYERYLERPVEELLKRRFVVGGDLIEVRDDMPLTSVVALFCEHRLSAVPVVDGAGRLVGLISYIDILNALDAGAISGRGSRRAEGAMAMETTRERRDLAAQTEASAVPRGRARTDERRREHPTPRWNG
jgi:acetoin utilization protein AcuB